MISDGGVAVPEERFASSKAEQYPLTTEKAFAILRIQQIRRRWRQHGVPAS